MAETPSYVYENQVEWKGEKDFRLSGGTLPDIAAGAPPEKRGIKINKLYLNLKYQKNINELDKKIL
jgi:hypothetical protein